MLTTLPNSFEHKTTHQIAHNLVKILGETSEDVEKIYTGLKEVVGEEDTSLWAYMWHDYRFGEEREEIELYSTLRSWAVTDSWGLGPGFQGLLNNRLTALIH